MRKKIVLLLVTMFALVSSSFGQIKLGVKGGINVTDLSFKNCLTLIVEHNHDTLLSYYCTQLLADLNQGVRLPQAIRNRNYFDDQLIFIFDNQTNHLIMKRDLETYSTLLLEQVQSNPALHRVYVFALHYIDPNNLQEVV